MSALPLRADMIGSRINVCFVPEADIYLVQPAMQGVALLVIAPAFSLPPEPYPLHGVTLQSDR